ncbi:MAG: bifunctional 2-C-methyl-D-erythritol 4-phosphate cytidylyltransferase/2-C-methyl-D-erythritol 2,4-cyclodiphosphate synthase [Roseibium sp.]
MPISAAALVVAAGRGSRLAKTGNDTPKQYRLLAGRSVLTHTLNALGKHPGICCILTVIHPDDTWLYNKAITELDPGVFEKLLPVVHGGSTRQVSVFQGLKALALQEADHVLIHDAARPFVTTEILSRLLHQLNEGKPGVLVATQVVDTLKRQGSAASQLETVDRDRLWAAQTPQAFAFPQILSAHERAANEGQNQFTDDTSLAEWDGMTISICEGETDNFKITTAADLERAEHFAKMNSTSDDRPADRPLSQLTDIRNGIGYDVHAFETGDSVILGGVAIPHTKKLKGHSDADVVLHAITDATLGAIGDGDIGQHFPPSDPQWEGAASDQFQNDAIRRVAALGGRLAHIDVTIVCEEPKIGPHRDKIRASIAATCKLPETRVSIKATTSEKLGFTGRKEGIAAYASVTVRLPMNDDE